MLHCCYSMWWLIHSYIITDIFYLFWVFGIFQGILDNEAELSNCFSIHALYAQNYLYEENSSEISAKREFSAVAILFSIAFSRTVVYHGLVESY